MFRPSLYNILDNDCIYNSLSDNFILFSDNDTKDKILSFLKNKFIETLNNSDLELLFELGFLVDDSVNELEIVKKQYQDMFLNNDILTITYLPTFKCNLNCAYCFQTDLKKDEPDNHLLIERFLNLKLKDIKQLNLALFGGEPLYEKEKLLFFLNTIKNLQKLYNFKLYISMTTNGTLLNSIVITELFNILPIDFFQITIDCNKEQHDSLRVSDSYPRTYDTIFFNIQTLILKYNTEVTIRINLLNNTLDDIQSTLDDILKIKNNKDNKGDIKIYYRPLYSTTSFKTTNKNKFTLEDFYKKTLENNLKVFIPPYFTCETTGGKNSFFLTSDGKLWKCLQEKTEKTLLGEIDNKAQVIYNENLENWTNPFLDLDKKCLLCKFLPKCFGGCRLKKIKNQENTCFYEKNFSLTTIFGGYYEE